VRFRRDQHRLKSLELFVDRRLHWTDGRAGCLEGGALATHTHTVKMFLAGVKRNLFLPVSSSIAPRRLQVRELPYYSGQLPRPENERRFFFLFHTCHSFFWAVNAIVLQNADRSLQWRHLAPLSSQWLDALGQVAVADCRNCNYSTAGSVAAHRRAFLNSRYHRRILNALFFASLSA
jgi:hypothetical protein